LRAAALFIAASLLSAEASAQGARPGDPPPAGWALSLGWGAGWHSNPLELTTRAKGDVFTASEIGLGYRLPLWQGAALNLNVSSSHEHYAREESVGFVRGIVTASLAQSWQGFTLSATAGHRKTMGHDLSRHDGASSEIGLNLARPLNIAEGWTLLLFGRMARRFVNDGTEDQFRANANATLIYRTGAWSFRAGGGFGYVLEDKTPLLPRINDRSINLRAGVGYEWAKDREITLGAGYTRTYSSYAYNRTRIFTLQPRVSATIRF
jgi:hypothetical protein